MKSFYQPFFVKGCGSRTFIARVVVVVMLLWSFSSAWADSLVFSQIDFNLGGTNYTDTEWGSVDFTFTGQNPIMYFNLAVNGTWQVQNIPALSIEGVGVEQTMTYYFDLGTERGTDVNNLNYDYAFTSDILDTIPGGSIPASVKDGEIAMWLGSGDLLLELNEPKPLFGGEVKSPKKHFLKGFPNQQCGPYECCPAAVSNSLQFLNKTHKLKMDPDEITIAKMKKATGFQTSMGCPSNWWELKDEYMEDHNLPIATKRVSNFSDLVAEIDANQDIEIQYYYYDIMKYRNQKVTHLVAMVSITPLKNGCFSLDVVDDQKQNDPGKGCEAPRTITYNPTQGENGLLWDNNGPNIFEFAIVECPYDPNKASHPKPMNGQNYVPLDPTLCWSPGYYTQGVNGHKVYFSEKFEDVNNRTAYIDSVTDPCLAITDYTGLLELGRTYYWVVDEVNDACEPYLWVGDVWSFMVRNYLVVDDMEDYNATDLIYDTWKDGPSNGTGSLVALESTTVHEDAQSMRFDYSNSSTPYTSEAQADVDDLPIDSNWAAAGVKALTLYFYGYLHNSIEPMWVELRDTSGNSAKMIYGYYSDENPNGINEASWHEWNIDLQEFVDSNGVSLTDVNDITIGFGDGTPGGGSGTVYFDDIRLYPPRCVLDKRDPNFATFDYAPIGPGGDCVIDAKELDVMFGDWLESGSTIYATAPNTPVACYDMEGNFNDRCGPYDGDPCNGAYMAYDATLGSNVAVFDGVGAFVELGTWNPSAATGQLGLCVWAQWYGNGQGRRNGIMGKRDSWSESNMMWQIEIDGNNGRTGFFRNGSDGTGTPYTMPVNEWVHIAVSFDGTTAIFYANGAEQGRGGFSFGPKTDSHFTFGCCQQNGGNPFYGKLDDVKVFDYGLSQSDILSVAGLSDLYIELTSAANICDKEPKHSKVVNFKDYTLVADRFLDEDMFPP